MQKYADLVELEKCCQTHIFSQKFVLIQPRTGPLKIAVAVAVAAAELEVAPQDLGDSRLGAAAQPVGLLLVSVGQLLLSLSTTAAESLKRRK